MSENSEKNSNIVRDSELPDQGSYSENNEIHMKDPLNGEKNVKKVIVHGSPCHKDDNCSLFDNMNLEKKDIPEGNTIKKTDGIGQCNKENMPKMESKAVSNGHDAPDFPVNDNAGVGEKSADILPVTPGRRKQASPRKRNVNLEQHEAENKIKAVKFCKEEIVPSKICKTEDFGKEGVSKLLNLNGGRANRNAKNTRKQGNPIKVAFPNVSASDRRRKPSNPKKKTPPTKKVVTPKTASAANKCNTRKKPKSPTVSKKITALDLDCNHSLISGDVSKTPEGLNEEMSKKTQPAVSLKIICTPFNQKGVEGTPVKEDTEIAPVCTSSKKKETLKNKKVSFPKKATKETKPIKNKAVRKKTSTPGKTSRTSTSKKNESRIVGAKATVKKGSQKKSPVTEHHSDMAGKPLPAKEVSKIVGAKATVKKGSQKKSPVTEHHSDMAGKPLPGKEVSKIVGAKATVKKGSRKKSPVTEHHSDMAGKPLPAKEVSKIFGAKATVKKGSQKKSPVTEHHSDMAGKPLPAKEEVSKIFGAKATVKKGSQKKSPVTELHSDMAGKPLPPKEEVGLKKTRGRRKMKKSEEYVVSFMSESDNDIEPDFSEDEYLPSKDEDPYVREKEKGEGKKNLRVSFSCYEEGDHDFDENVEKLQNSFESYNKSKKKKTATKVQTSPTVSQTKKVKITFKNKKEKEKPSESEDGNSQNESGQDMPLLSPSKGLKSKQKKRRIRIQPEKTYLDGLDNYATGEEDMGMTTATDDEGDCLVKVRKRRKRYGEPYSVTGNWYIAQGYLLDISNLIEKFVAKDGWRFRDFVTCWQQLKFSLVYRGRQNFKELLELSEEIAFLTKRFIMPPHSTKTRIGSLYALYGLYYKHPFRSFFKIRLLGEEYEQLVDLIRPFQSDTENHDPAYIFRKLELDGAILHVASSLEMGIDFYNAEREAVDIKYESQRLANSSIVARTLVSELLDGDDEILKQYHNTKINVAGDGKESEKSLSFVEASITGEIKEVVKNLKEETLSILRLNDPPTAKVVPSTESENNFSSIGARRAEIMAKAVKSDTSSEYLKKKCFREPSKLWDKPSKQVSLRQGLSDENDSAMSNRDVQEFMKAPTKETLDKPLIPQRRSKRKVSHKYLKRHFEEENEQITASETIGNESLSDQWEEQEGESSVVDENVGNCEDPLSDELEILSRVPPVLPKPKRTRGPPRKKVLSQAIKVNKVDHDLTGLKALKRKVSDEELVKKRRKRRQLKKVEPDEESAADLSRIIVDLPPVKVEASVDMVHDTVNEIFTSSELKTNGNEKLTKQENLDHTITLNIQLKAENLYKNQHFKILNNNWMAIQDNKRKLDRLKKKLISIILPNHVKQTVDEDKVDVEITVIETEDTEIVCDADSTFQLKTDTSSIDLVSSTIHDFNQVESDDHYSLAGAKNITLKTEKPDYSPQKKICSTSDVIKDLQGMWESDSNDNGIDSVDEEPYDLHSYVTKTEDFWSTNVCNEEHKIFPDSSIKVTKDYMDDGRSEDFHDDKSFVDLVSDVDDFEDESEPIILTPGIVCQRPGYSLNYNNIIPAENYLKLGHSTAATPLCTSASLVGSHLELKEKAIPIPLYRRADQATESHSPGPFNPTSLSKRYITYNSPIVVSGGQNPALVPVSTSLPLLKSQYPQKGSLLIEQPSYIQLSSDSIRPPAPYNQSFTACGDSPSTASHTVYSSPESCLGSQIIVSSQSVTTVGNQSPLLCVPAPARFPGSVTITPQRLTQGSEIPGISTSPTYAHNPTSVSIVGPRVHTDLGGMKLVKVKISDTQSVLIPESKIVTSASQIDFISKTGKKEYADFSIANSSGKETPSSVTKDDGNHSTEMHTVMTSGLPISDIHHQTPSSNDSVAQRSFVGQDGGLKCESNSSWVSNESKSSFSTTSSGKVCSFLFSPKFTKRSGIKNPTVQATGVPVGPKKLKVPFFFKHSLVPKKKSL